MRAGTASREPCYRRLDVPRPRIMWWVKLIAIVAVLALLGGLIYLGVKIPPNDSGSDG